MATNKHASIRYLALDKCFSNFGRMYFIDDLVDACNRALYDYTGLMEGVKKRQVYEDINYMQSEQGWDVPLEKFKYGKQVYYRYSDSNFSISKKPITQEEAKQLKEAMSILLKFKGMPQFEWIDELGARINNIFQSDVELKKVVDFEENQYLEGINHFADVFNLILNRRVAIINYRGFKQLKAQEVTLHPYYLKQYNNRWFVFGYNEQFGEISNLALDRIICLKETDLIYRANTFADFDEYFDDIIGVTVPPDAAPERIILKISDNILPYLKTKPLHGSQILKVINSVNLLFLNLIVNYELKALIFSYSDNVEVIEPLHLREEIRDTIRKSVAQY